MDFKNGVNQFPERSIYIYRRLLFTFYSKTVHSWSPGTFAVFLTKPNLFLLKLGNAPCLVEEGLIFTANQGRRNSFEVGGAHPLADPAVRFGGLTLPT